MLDNFLFSINVILPIFCIAAIGFFLGRIGFLPPSFTEIAERVVFRIALPVMLFLELRSASVSSIDMRLILFCIISVTAVFILVSLGTQIFIRKDSVRGAFVQGSCRSNFAVLGIPLAESMFGEAGVLSIAMVMPFVIIMFNAYSVIVLSHFSGKNHKQSLRSALRDRIREIVTNPLILAVLLAIPFLIWNIPLPAFAENTLGYIGNLSTPLALLCLGANFRKGGMQGRTVYALLAAAVKLVALPVCAVSAALALGFRGVSLGTIFVLFSSPSAVSSYIMAKNMDNDSILAAQILLFTTAGCMVTIFGGVFILKSLSFI